MKHFAAVVVGLVTTIESASAQDPLSMAKDLYTSAAYEDALSALARVKEGTPELAQQVDQYRAFSLFALGRTAEAESVVETVIRRDPLVKPEGRDAPPRITAMFTQVRQRLLPELIRDGYRSARDTMETGGLAAAVPKLEQVHSLIAEAKAAGEPNEALTDMGVLVDGFLDLARSTANRAESDAAAVKAETAAPPPASTPAAVAATIVGREPTVFTVTAADVVAPVAIRQQIPTIPYSLARRMTNSKGTGVLEVTINEKGRVVQAIMWEPVNPFFDSIVIAAARSWQYKAATKDGAPVKYTKRIAVSVASIVK